MTDNEKRLTYTVDEVATLLGVGRNTAYEAVKAGEIPSMKIRRRLVVPVFALRMKLLGVDLANLSDTGIESITATLDKSPVTGEVLGALLRGRK